MGSQRVEHNWATFTHSLCACEALFLSFFWSLYPLPHPSVYVNVWCLWPTQQSNYKGENVDVATKLSFGWVERMGPLEILWKHESPLMFIPNNEKNIIAFKGDMAIPFLRYNVSCCLVMSDSLWPHELQHARLPCPSPTPGAYSNSCPLSRCHPVMPSNHLILCCPLLFLPSIFLSIRVFSNESVLRIGWPKYWSFSFSISPSNEYSDWFPLGWTGWISLQSKGLSRVFPHTTYFLP